MAALAILLYKMLEVPGRIMFIWDRREKKAKGIKKGMQGNNQAHPNLIVLQIQKL